MFRMFWKRKMSKKISRSQRPLAEFSQFRRVVLPLSDAQIAEKMAGARVNDEIIVVTRPRSNADWELWRGVVVRVNGGHVIGDFFEGNNIRQQPPIRLQVPRAGQQYNGVAFRRLRQPSPPRVPAGAHDIPCPPAWPDSDNQHLFRAAGISFCLETVAEQRADSIARGWEVQHPIDVDELFPTQISISDADEIPGPNTRSNPNFDPVPLVAAGKNGVSVDVAELNGGSELQLIPSQLLMCGQPVHDISVAMNVFTGEKRDRDDSDDEEEPFMDRWVRNNHRSVRDSIPAFDANTSELPATPPPSQGDAPLNDQAFRCEGCQGFECVATSQLSAASRREMLQILRSEEVADRLAVLSWAQKHELIPKIYCTSCAKHFTPSVDHGRPTMRCPACRKSKSVMYPGNFSSMLAFFLLYAEGSKIHRGSQDFKGHRETRDKWNDVLNRITVLWNASCLKQGKASWSKMEWDESWLGQRKFNRGRRVRRAGAAMMQGGVSVGPDGSMLCGVLTMALTKAQDDVLPLIEYLGTVGATVMTDGAITYKALEQDGFIHKWVNHSKAEFVRREKNDDGTETVVTNNRCECLWRLVKHLLRNWFDHLPSSQESLGFRVQVALFFVNAGLKGLDKFAALCTAWRWFNTVKKDVVDVLFPHCLDLFGICTMALVDAKIAKEDEIAAQKKKRAEAAQLIEALEDDV